MGGQGRHFYEFGPFRLDPAERLLLREGRPVALAPKVFDTLVVLVRHGGHLVGKEQLLCEVWPDQFVEEVNLSVNVSALRKALGEGARGARYIETVSKRGYRFVAAVTESADGDAELVVEERFRARILTEEIETNGGAEASAGVTAAPEVAVKRPAVGRWPGRKGLAVGLIVSLVAVAVAVAALNLRRRPEAARRDGAPPPAQAVPLSVENVVPQKLTNTGDICAGTISPDGQFVVYATCEGGERAALWLRRTASKNALPLLPLRLTYYWGLTISPDGNDVYYVVAGHGGEPPALYRIPVLGGEPRKLTERIDSAVTFSPDGKRMAFDRFAPGRCDLVTANAADGSDERVVASANSTTDFLSPQWSPDGSTILYFVIERTPEGRFWHLAEIPAGGGEVRRLTAPSRQRIWFVAWAPGGGILLNATDPVTNRPQLYHVSYPDLAARRLTNDLANYFGGIASADGGALLCSQQERRASVWVASDLKDVRPRRLTADADQSYSLSWTPGGRIVFDAAEGGRYHIWVMDGDGGRRQQLSPDEFEEWQPDVSPDGRYIVFLSNRSGAREVWRMDGDGRNPVQLTAGNNNAWLPRFAPDGRAVYFEMSQGPKTMLARVPVEGGEPVPVCDDPFGLWTVSPDSRRLAYSFFDERRKQTRVAVRPVGAEGPTDYFDFTPGRFLRWTPDGEALAYEQGESDPGQGSAFWVQPLAGGPARRLFSFQPDTVYWAEWSRDGKQLALVRSRRFSDLVLLTRAKARQ